MKKVSYVFYLLLVVVVGCNIPTYEEQVEEQKVKDENYKEHRRQYAVKNRMITIEFDGCEYVMDMHEMNPTHKGNCKYHNN